MEKIIEVQDLVKEFGDLTAVKEIDFHVKRGELFGFLGPNGAGKTTTIKILCTLLRPNSGQVRVNGYDVQEDPASVRKSLGLVFQESSLDENLTAEENLRFHGNLYGVERNTLKKRIDEVLEMVELSDRKKGIVRKFSGGMKRRLELARGLLHYPQILFLDEPTLGLDPQTRNRIWEYIQELKEEKDITIFLTTHYMDEAEYCDRIAIIDHGEIIALDSPDQLKSDVGGDVIRIKVNGQEERVQKEIEERYDVEVRSNRGYLFFEKYNGEEFVPEFVSQFREEIRSISLNRPTLDDVFLQLTGKELRDETADAGDRMRMRHSRRSD